MKNQFTNSLIISTYNWPEALELCLLSILQQKVMPDEIIIADDGSTEATKNVIYKYKSNFPIALHHVWHPDEGFQLAKIRNKAIAAASGDYIIQIDGDLILNPYFIRDHLSHAEQNYFVTGSRVLLRESATKIILDKKKIKIGWLIPGSKNFLNGLRSNILRKFLSKRYKVNGENKYYVKGCNMAFWKKDLITVNGYNENFTGWGKEDNEIAIKLINSGIKKRFLKFSAICYHLYHKHAPRESEVRNIQILNNAIKNKVRRTNNGIDKYL